jgi:predicted anti-sigma-YlaC factor YlaD
MSTGARVLFLVLACGVTGCLIRSEARRSLGPGFSTAFSNDDDPELVGDALPAALKTIEGLLESSPRDRALLLAACSGFARYAYGWLQQEADFTEAKSLSRATELRARARNLHLRARDYGLRGLEVDAPGLRDRLRGDPTGALAATRKVHVPLLYWTAVAWASAVSLHVDDSDLSADLPLAEALARRALVLDEGYESGAIHDFFITYEGGRAALGGSRAEARRHLEQAIARGPRAFPYVRFAESVCVAEQNRQEFLDLIGKALAVDTSGPTPHRTADLVAQKRARWLRGRADELFLQ